MIAWLYLALAAVNSCLGNLCLKYSRIAILPDALWWQKLWSPWFVAGMFFYALNVVVFAKSLDSLPVSVAYPVLASAGFVLLALASTLLLGESLSWVQWGGIVAIIAGIVLIVA